MLKHLIENLVYGFFKFILWFRYRITVKGLEHLNPNTLSKPGGVLFLPNHPAVFVDPVAVTIAIWKKFPLRPIVVEYLYYAPVIYSLMKYLDALPIPNNEVSSNSLKRKRSEKILQSVAKGLHQGQNFLIYPAGRLKNGPQEIVGGASGVHQILQEAPEANVVLVRTTGLWGSSFSKAFTGRTPPIFPAIFRGIKQALMNFIFFTPRRHITIEFVPAPADFPYKAPRMELNRYLENWYNKNPEKPWQIGEPLSLVSYRFWKQVFLEAPPIKQETPESERVDLASIPEEVQQKVIAKLAELTEKAPDTITPEMNISNDLGLDSLDTSELVVFLEEEFDIKAVPVRELTTVSKMMAIASRLIVCNEEEEENVGNLRAWHKALPHKHVKLSPGKTLPEVFLNSCEKLGNSMACADLRMGALSYSTLKLRTLILAEYIRKLPGDHVGIMLPASIAAGMLVLACQLAGKVPVLVNWTAGPRHLDSVIKLSGVKVIFTSWAFTDRLTNVDLAPIDDLLVMLEDVRREIGLIDKLKGFWRSKKSAASLLKLFHADKLSESDRAVLVFTSGTESMPKGVPLTHKNIISNQRGACEVVDFFADDVILGILPPFHAFGLTISCLLALMCGIRVAYLPDPTDGKAVAKGVERWGATLTCGAPTFLKKMFKAATPEQLKTLRFIVTGAEKAPQDLFDLANQLGVGDRMLEGYGITECSPVLTINYPGVPAKGVGQALKDVELCIVHPETLEVLPTGTQGLIIARGPNIFSGYLNPGLASPFVTVDGKEWYQTGDLGFFDEMGRLTISGRLKRFIKLGGEMISLTAIEDALLQAASKKGWQLAEEGPSVAVCAKEIANDKAKIFVFTKFTTSTDEVNQTLKEAGFTNLVKVSNVQRLDEIPLMGTGKIYYRELEAKYLSSV